MKSSSIVAMTAAAALCLSAGVASATALTFTQSGNSWYANNLSNIPVTTSTFSDMFTFTDPVTPLSAQAAGSTNAISLSSGGSLIFDLFQLVDSFNNNILGTGTMSNGGTVSMFNFNLPINSTHTYTLTVDGHLVSPATSGAYSGNMVISQVPEPKTYAMLLAGLGLLAFTARRRKTGFF